MKLFALFSLRYRLLFLVLIAVLPSLWLILHTASEHRRTSARDIKQNALHVVRLASSGQERLIEGAHQLLVVMALLSEVRGHDPEAAHAVLSKLLKKYSTYTNFGVIELDGSVFASAQPLPGDVNLKDRSYFRRAVETGDFVMGDYQIGRITKKPAVNFGYPVVDDSGKIIRVVFAALDLAWLEQLATQAELPEGATLTVVDAQGTVLVGFPNPEKWRGKSIRNQPILPIISASHEGTAEIVDPNGLPQLFAFVHLRGAAGTGFVSVSIGIPNRVAFSEPNRILKQNLTWLGVVAALALAAAWFGGEFFVLQRIRVLASATKRVEAGDLAARSGLRYGHGEIGQLAHAFDEMAVSLQQRGEERDQAEEKLKKLNEELERRVAQRTHELREKNEQFEADLDLAREFQVGMLPVRYPEFIMPDGKNGQSIRFSHCYEPSGGVGGDFFDILPISKTEAGIFVCDVMGHGVRAALVTAIIRGLVEELKPLARKPGEMVGQLNRALAGVLRESGATMFATAVFMVADFQRGRLTFTNAGHPKPVHLRRNTGVVEPMQLVNSAICPVLGLFQDAVYSVAECDFAPGDAVLTYTDGVFEVSNRDGDQYGEQRLMSTIRKSIDLPIDRIFAGVLREIREFSAGVGFEDDVCMVGFEQNKD